MCCSAFSVVVKRADLSVAAVNLAACAAAGGTRLHGGADRNQNSRGHAFRAALFRLLLGGMPSGQRYLGSAILWVLCVVLRARDSVENTCCVNASTTHSRHLSVAKGVDIHAHRSAEHGQEFIVRGPNEFVAVRR